MKTITRYTPLAAFLLILIAPVGVRAQDSESSSSAAAPASAAPAGDEPNDSMMGSAFGGDFQFDRIEFADAQYDPDGSFHFVADHEYQVVMKGKQMDLTGDDVVYRPDTKIMVATGKPVKVRMEQLHSECRKMTYNLDKKTIKLEGKPFITQNTKDSTTRIYGNEINLYQNKEGQWGFTISNSGKERTGPGVIEMNSNEDANSTASKAKSEPQKVTRENAAINIPLPSLAE